MTDNDSVSKSVAQTLPCGHQHKPGTRFCTVCGVPVPAQISAQDAFVATQTVQARDNPSMPGGFSGPAAYVDDTSAPTRLRPRVPREPDPSWQAEPPRLWRPGEDWQPGPERQPQQQWPPQRQWEPPQDWQQPAQSWPAQQPATPWGQQGGQWQQPAAWEQQPQWGQPGGQWQQPVPTGQPSSAFPATQRATAGRSRMPVIAGVVVAAVLLGGGAGSYLLLAHHNTPTPTPSASNSGRLPPTSPATTPPVTATTTTTTAPPTTPAVAEQQAATNLANLLQQSVSDRNAINQAYSDVLNCGSLLGQDQQTFQQAASSRQGLISQLSSLPGASALPTQMLSDLTSAWQASATVDQDYAQWAADENSNGCVANDTSNSSYVAADGPNGQATSSKTAFVSLWNPIAQKYGLTQYSQDQL